MKQPCRDWKTDLDQASIQSALYWIILHLFRYNDFTDLSICICFVGIGVNQKAKH